MDPRHSNVMQLPIVIVNTKTYPGGTSQAAVNLAKTMEKIHLETGANLAIAVQPTDIFRIAETVTIPVIGQHSDSITYGSHTGWILPESIQEAGATGALLNHSERPLHIADIASAIARLHEVGLKAIVCANNINVAAAVASLKPDMVAIEPPDLIGGNISVTTAKPEIVRDAVSAVHHMNPDTAVLCGAGVKTGIDVATALKLGTAGVLLASGVVNAADQEKVLREMVKLSF